MAACLRAVLLLLLMTGSALADIDTYEFKDSAQEQRFHSLLSELRCPKCQNQTIADSNAPLSQDLRQRVYAMMQAGHNDANIIDFMVTRYGDFITYKPPFKPLTWVLWFGPFTVMTAAVLGVGIWVRRRGRQPPPELSESERARLDSLLQDSDKEP